MTKLHAHFETSSTDCDGRTDRSYVITMNDDELADQDSFGDINFHDRVVAMVVNSYSLLASGTLSVSKLDDDSVRLIWTEATDEGGRHVEVRICADESCDTGETDYRDHRAESMGY